MLSGLDGAKAAGKKSAFSPTATFLTDARDRGAMVLVLQALGIAYLAFMLYLTFLYYKRNQYTFRNFIFWVAIWLIGIILLVMPETSSVITERLAVPRVLDFYLVLGLMCFSILCFFSFANVKRNEQKIEELVRKLALEKRK